MPNDKFYKEIFEDISIDQIKDEINSNPLFKMMVDVDKLLLEGAESELREVYMIVKSSFDKSMRDVIGESFYEDGYCDNEEK